MSSGAVAIALERISSKDKDYRYMGTSDLLNEIQKDTFQVDPETERKLCVAVLKQLEDVSGDISGLALKCLAPLSRKTSPSRLSDMISSLASKLLTGKDATRDVASMALKSIIAEVPQGTAAAEAVCHSLPAKLLEATEAESTKTEVAVECFDVLSDLLQKFGSSISSLHPRACSAAVSSLSSSRAALRKRAVQSLASLAPHLSTDLLSSAVSSLATNLENSKGMKADVVRSNLQAVGSLCRSGGPRFGPHIPLLLPLLLRLCGKATGGAGGAGGAGGGAEGDDEIGELCLQSLEAFVSRCPAQMAPFVQEVQDLCLRCLSYDPNYTDMEEEMEQDADAEEQEEEEDDEEEEGEDEDYSDDEDSSWKVRRAAAKTLSAIILSCPDMLPALYGKSCPKLIERFKEREENVKVDVFAAFTDLLRQTQRASKVASGGGTELGSPLRSLEAEVPRLVKSLTKLLGGKSAKTKIGAFSVLHELLLVLPSCLSPHLPLLLPAVCKALEDRSSPSSLRIGALSFARIAISSHPPATLQPVLKSLLPAVLSSVADRYYKVSAEALRVCSQVIVASRPSIAAVAEGTVADGSSSSRTQAGGKGEDFSALVSPILTAVHMKLVASDQDQEVKEEAISCASLLVAVLGDQLPPPSLSSLLSLLRERLGNEITRLTAVKAFNIIARSPLPLSLDAVLQPLVADLTSFLRKSSRSLRQACLSSLSSLLLSHSRFSSIPSASAQGMLTEAAELINDSDLATAAQSLDLCCAVLEDKECRPPLLSVVRDRVLPQALLLARSPLLQGHALQSLEAFFSSLVRASPSDFPSLLNLLLSADTSAASSHPSSSSSSSAAAAVRGAHQSARQARPTHSAGGGVGYSAAGGGGGGRSGGAATSYSANKLTCSSIAKCVAVLCLASGEEQCASTVQMLLRNVQLASSGGGGRGRAVGDGLLLLSLLCLGEIGRRVDLGSQQDLPTVLLQCLHVPSDETKAAASFALGSIAAGSHTRLLPVILAQIDAHPKLQYLLLHSLKEVVSGPALGRDASTPEALSPADTDKILALLLSHTESEEEGVRTVVAECLGRLSLLAPSQALLALQDCARSPSTFRRATSAMAVRLAILEAPAAAAAGGGEGTDAQAAGSDAGGDGGKNSRTELMEALGDKIGSFLELIKDEDKNVRRAAVVTLATTAHNKPSLVANLLEGLLPALYDQMVVKKELIRSVDLGPFKHTIDDGLELRKSAFDCADVLLSSPSCAGRVDPAAFITPHLAAGLADSYDVKMPCHLILAKLALSAPSCVLEALDTLLEPLEKTILTRTKADAVKQEVDRNTDIIRSALRALCAISRISHVESSPRFLSLLSNVAKSAQLQALYSQVQKENEAQLGGTVQAGGVAS